MVPKGGIAVRFTKMQGLGNDYIYLNCLEHTPEDLPGLARRLSDRHFGVGGDGLICICPSGCADFRMRMFNADGSEGRMCGNGIRCVGKYVYDRGLTAKTALDIETAAGVKHLALQVEGGKTAAVTVDMGAPGIGEPIPVLVKGQTYTGRPVDMGNPHLVVYWDGLDGLPMSSLGPRFEVCPRFPDRVNTEFVRVDGRGELTMRVWERGSGETLACGTGACAAAVCAITDGLADHHVAVRLPGGTLRIQWDGGDAPVYMTGPAVTVFEGEITGDRSFSREKKNQKEL